MSEGAAKKPRFNAMTIIGMVAVAVIIGFAFGFPLSLYSYCSAPPQSEQPVPNHVTVEREETRTGGGYAEQPPITRFSFGERFLAPIQEQTRTQTTYYAASEPYVWGRKFWCEVNASDYFIALFTLVLAAVTGFLWWSTHKLWLAGEEQIAAATTAADAANLSARAAVAIHLPVILAATPELISVQNPPPETGTYGGTILDTVPTQYTAFNDLIFGNEGNGHAYPTRISLGWCIAYDLPEQPIFHKQIDSPRDSIIRSGKSAVTGTGNICIEASPDQIAQLASANAFIWIYGKLEYLDFLKEPNEAWFFWRWNKIEGGEHHHYQFSRPTVVPAAYTAKQS